MMSETVAALKESSRCLLAAVRSGAQDQLLPDLLRRRQAAIRALATARQAGHVPTADDAEEISHLDAELIAAAAHRRDQIGVELAGLRRGRRAGTAYMSPASGTPRFVDRSG